MCQDIIKDKLPFKLVENKGFKLSCISVTIQIFHFYLIWLRFYFYFYKLQDIMLCIYSRRKGAILNEEVIRNCNGLGLWNKIKSNKNRINN